MTVHQPRVPRAAYEHLSGTQRAAIRRQLAEADAEGPASRMLAVAKDLAEHYGVSLDTIEAVWLSRAGLR